MDCHGDYLSLVNTNEQEKERKEERKERKRKESGEKRNSNNSERQVDPRLVAYSSADDVEMIEDKRKNDRGN
jgi:hypothetical protein